MASSGVYGDWAVPSKSIVRIYKCGNYACAKIVKLADTVPVRKDVRNPDASQHNRSLCGLNIGSNFTEVDSSHLKDGHLYDPKSGHTYSGTISSVGNDLHLRGYIGFPIFGRSEIWHRVPATDESQCR